MTYLVHTLLATPLWYMLSTTSIVHSWRLLLHLLHLFRLPLAALPSYFGAPLTIENAQAAYTPLVEQSHLCPGLASHYPDCGGTS